MPVELVNTISEQGFRFDSPNFQDGFDIALVSSSGVVVGAQARLAG